MQESVEKYVAVSLWRLETGNSYQCIAKTFAIGKSTAVKISKDFRSALRLQSCTYIKFSDSAGAAKCAIEMFQADYNCKIPQSLGAIDCTHIFIKGPNCESKYDYYCRSQRYLTNAKAVVGANLYFSDVATGFPGSMHDTRVLRQTNLSERAESGVIFDITVKKIRNVEVRPLILGDGRYPLRNWLVKPFNFTAALSEKEKRFNRVLSSSRVSVERAFGLLKGRWRCLLTTLDANIKNVPDVIICCFILHNFLPNECWLLRWRWKFIRGNNLARII